jgi:hypothetical protein
VLDTPELALDGGAAAVQGRLAQREDRPRDPRIIGCQVLLALSSLDPSLEDLQAFYAKYVASRGI